MNKLNSQALGLKMLGLRFQLSIMNNTEPSTADIKEFQDNLTFHRAKVLIINNQIIDPLTERMQQMAEKAHKYYGKDFIGLCS